MTAAQFYALILDPAATMLSHVNPKLDTPAARLQLLATAGQETSWSERVQIPGGQARGFWQCEQGGALTGVVNGPVVATLAAVCDLYAAPTDIPTLFEAIAWHDPIAYTVARLALWMDPAPLPAIGNIDAAWDCYIKNWRPGAPSRDRWNVVYPQALAVIKPAP